MERIPLDVSNSQLTFVPHVPEYVAALTLTDTSNATSDASKDLNLVVFIFIN